jgi:glutamine synthetase
VARCFAGIETVLADDGLDNAGDAEPYEYFSKITRSPSKRIVRIEQVAASIFEAARAQHEDMDDSFTASLASFTSAIKAAIADPEVVGFKSVICYRTGLDIPGIMSEEKARSAFKDAFATTGFSKINHPGLNEYLVHLLASILKADDQSFKKPIQFHTGLGDNDLTLNKSSPAHLQHFIRAYPTVTIVLLHSGYPFTRETGYLAAMYVNVYADIGEVFPFLSRNGQEGVVHQILELCPGSKILWSTDGHWFPETYLLAVDQMKEVMHTVLSEYVRKGDLNSSQAAGLVRDIFFNNANRIYDLGLDLAELSPTSETNGVVPPRRNSQLMDAFLQRHRDLKYLRVYFLDMTATPRARAVPVSYMRTLLRNDDASGFSVTKASLGLLQDDMPVPGSSSVGAYTLHPDFSALCLGPRDDHFMAMGTFKELDGSAATLCPRTLLMRALDEASRQGLAFVLGFEIELLIMRREAGHGYRDLEGDGHAWSVSRAMEHPVVATVLEEAIEKMAAAGIHIEMVHPESASGQYEVVLPKAPALQAVDTLIYAREIISATCAAKGYKMTLHPKPFATEPGTAAHVHMSISSANGSEKRVYEPFYAGILRHFNAVCAFTYSNMLSYERVRDSCWAGGTWVAWGTQNRETPLRKIKDSHWEVKCLDGMANPYLAMAALLQAGMSGIENGDELVLGDCLSDPASLTDSQRDALGITSQIPSSIEEALAALKEDPELCRRLGTDIVDRYISTKKAETMSLGKMSGDEQRLWVMERY